MPVSADDVRNAYRFILGREPENAEAVAAHQSRAADLADLRRNFIESAEFQSKMASGALYRAKDDFMMSLSDLHFMTVLEQGRYRHPLSLSHHHAQVYSQNGEDGIIAEIFYRISVQDKFFVEIGTENGQQNNTRFLLEQGWRGAWVDSDFGDAHTTFANFINSGVLSLIEGSVTAENINALLDQRAVPAAFDFLSLDIDQNTSHVWRALQRRARVSCIEYNASIPASVALEAPYDPSARWDGTNWYGGSLKALEQIGAIKEMSLVGCELCGVNAFFVDKREAINRFREPFTAETHWEPPRYHLAAHTGHSPSKSARYWRLANG
jgi:hypothetical protein